MGTTDPNRSGVFKPYKDPNKVPILLLTIGLMLGLVMFLVWALETMRKFLYLLCTELAIWLARSGHPPAGSGLTYFGGGKCPSRIFLARKEWEIPCSFAAFFKRSRRSFGRARLPHSWPGSRMAYPFLGSFVIQLLIRQGESNLN